MKLSLGLTQLSVHVYLLRTFKDDLLLFFNNVSLRKPLATEEVRHYNINKPAQIVKLECKLYNQDKMHVASLYLDLQRQGHALPHHHTDFMEDFVAKLNLLAA